MAMRMRADDGSAAPGRPAVEGAPMALPPGQGGLHLSPHDSIGVVNDRTGAAVPRADDDGAAACDGGTAPREPGTGLLAELEWRGILHATTPGLAERLATGRPISGLHRVRSERRLAPRRPPRADLRTASTPAFRRAAHRGRRRWDRDDRRPLRALERAQPARPRDARAQRRRGSAASSSGSSTSRPARVPRRWSTTSTGSASCR